jgi:hypothetical protein
VLRNGRDEGGEKTILQSNNMVALRVVYYSRRCGMDTISQTTLETTFDGRDRNVHIPTGPPQVFG